MTNRKNYLTGHAAAFGPFRLMTSERLLMKGNEPVVLGGRALDILIALIESAGMVLSQRELMERVWRNVFVEEANLRVHIATLRKVLRDGQDGQRYIVNVPGRGYSFVAAVEHEFDSGASLCDVSALPAMQKLPMRLARMVGRENTISALADLLKTSRFVSIVGPGGIGKTTVAVAVADAMVDYFRDGVCFVDLGTLTDGTLVAGAIASSTGCFVRSHDPVASLFGYLADKKILLVLDNCEHVIDSAAALSEGLAKACPHVHLLITSREALRVEGENVHLLSALDFPDAETELTAAKALTYASVQLFMERSAAAGNRRELGDGDAVLVAEICRRLDGIPLVIELAAGRVGTYGIRETANLLDKQIDVLWRGRRSSPPRQQTLHAMFDWSYKCLSDYEQKILRRLSVFAGVFSLDAAQCVVGDVDDAPATIAKAIASLVEKSLIWVSDERDAIVYRLLYTTRSYVAAKLTHSGESDAVARRHAQYFNSRLKSYSRDIADCDVSHCFAHSANVRAALDWSFSSTGDALLGVEIVSSAAPFFIRFSLLDECERWCRRALSALPKNYNGTRCELLLLEAVGISSIFTRGNSNEVRSAIERGLELAERLNDLERQLHLLAGMNLFLIRIGDFRSALGIAHRSKGVAEKSGDISALTMVEWMLGVAYHLIGDQAAAQRHCERGFELADRGGQVNVDFFGYDHHVRARVAMARALWLRGYPKRAVKFARQAVTDARSRNHPVAVSISYIYSIPIFLWVGNLDEAAQHIETLIAHTARHSLEPYHAVARALKGELMIANGEAAGGVELLHNAIATFNADRHHVLTSLFNRALAEGMARCGRFEDAMLAIDETIARSDRLGKNFDFPDLLRARGDILLMRPEPDFAAAEEAFLQSLRLAQEQSSLGWELRAALPLGRILARRGCVEKAHALLAGIRARFVDGDWSKDLRDADELLAEFAKLRSLA